MKIIDLLNKIANGEEVPKEIKYNSTNYKFNEDCLQYYNSKDFNENTRLLREIYNGRVLNRTVEIIEEEPRDIEVCGSWFTKSEYNKLARTKENKIEKEELFKIDESMTKASLVAWQKANNGIFKKQIDLIIDKINNMEE